MSWNISEKFDLPNKFLGSLEQSDKGWSLTISRSTPPEFQVDMLVISGTSPAHIASKLTFFLPPIMQPFRTHLEAMLTHFTKRLNATPENRQEPLATLHRNVPQSLGPAKPKRQ